MIVFARVVELRGFSAAARQLGMTKSAVSKQVSALERLLGVKLLNRSTRALSLTEAGQAVYERAAQAAGLMQEAASRVADLAQVPRGNLRVTASVAFGKLCIAPLLPEFLRRFPEVRIRLALLDRMVDLAEEGFDVAIRLTPAPPPSLVARRLMPVDYIVCASPPYLREHPVAEPRDLAACNCLYYGYGEFGDTWIFERDGRRESVKIDGNVVVNNSEVVRDLMLAGLGVGLVARYAVADALQDRRLVPLLEEWTPIGPFGQHAYALWLPQPHLPPKTRAFVDYLRERLPPGPRRAAAPEGQAEAPQEPD